MKHHHGVRHREEEKQKIKNNGGLRGPPFVFCVYIF